MFAKRVFSVVLIVVLALPALAIVPFAGAQEGPTMPLADPGPYGVGKQELTFVDDSREGRSLLAVIWYPAQGTSAVSYLMPKADAEADRSGAPYPLILYSPGLWDSANNTLMLGPYLVSHGYVVASIQHLEGQSNPDYSASVVDRPLDVLFVLNQLAAQVENEWEGLIDPDNVGIAGWSYGGTTSLWVSGAQVDPGYLQNWCGENEPGAEPNTGFSGSACRAFMAHWDQVNAYHDQFASPSGDELWPPVADEHIRAAVSITPCFYPLLGEKGVESVTLPSLIVYPAQEEICIPSDGARLIYDHLGSSERYLMTMLDGAHTTVLEIESVKKVLRQVTVAFFGYYLQGREDYAQYLTGEYVGNLLPNVTWESSLE